MQVRGTKPSGRAWLLSSSPMIERCVSLASEHPLQFALVHEDIRRVVAHHFPYSVYFRTEPSRIVVLAVFHGSRDPATWLARTK